MARIENDTIYCCSFHVRFEARRHYRKKTNLSGIFVTKEITDFRCDFRIDVSFLYGFDYVCGDSEYL